MRQQKRCFGVKLISGGKLKLIGFLSEQERAEYCGIKENHTRPITMQAWRKVPKDMKG
jgi:hypothetical protein